MTKSKKKTADQQNQMQDDNQQPMQMQNQQMQSQNQNRSQSQSQSQSQQAQKPKSKPKPKQMMQKPKQIQDPGTAQEFGRTVELTFVDHPWPASRTELIEHASRQGAFAKSDLARLKRIPHRDYHSVADLMQATREVEMATAQGPGQVQTAEQNRRAMGRDSADAHVSSAEHFEEPIH